MNEEKENLLFQIRELEKKTQKEFLSGEKKSLRLAFRATKSEKKLLELKSKWFVKPISDLMRASVFNYRIPDPEELALRKTLNSLNANQARLGNLLNQWLASEYHSDITNELRSAENIMLVLELLNKNQKDIKQQLSLLNLGNHPIQLAKKRNDNE